MRPLCCGWELQHGTYSWRGAVAAAGTVQGADFGSQARKAIEHKLRKGMSVEEIEWRLKHPGQDWQPAAVKAAAPAPPKEAPKQDKPKQQEKQQEKQKQQVEEKLPPPPPKAAAPPPAVEVGQSMVSHKRDPLKLIKVGGLGGTLSRQPPCDAVLLRLLRPCSLSMWCCSCCISALIARSCSSDQKAVRTFAVCMHSC
jgi:DNA-binding transcriptional MerR regulator